ncbi:AMP-binding protein [Labilibaculum manganireducens]|uniref:Long-chain fatty acid--CoA ligase n=1 Tax=Labilibaculum manganireducens TaxID=1940525 RepID=A0A2N3HWG6_9BACT|nr:AMP-binding protein [Labilibaculum manganireducens]PKQ62368.1 long-chain fatty acid--CoA ligase [Labilibaculum manganireducens]
MIENKLIEKIRKTIHKNWEQPAFTNYQKDTLTYQEVAQRIHWMHLLFKELGIKKGDKIAVIGRNLNNWAVTYLGTITYGAVIVPILPDFNSSDIHHIVNHSESTLLFTTENIFNKIDDSKIEKLKGIISLEDYNVFCSSCDKLKKSVEKANAESLKNRVDKNKLDYANPKDEDIAVLSYTSGTSGFSKGVMLAYESLYSNIQIGFDYMDFRPQDKIVSFLPLAHVFGCMFEFLTEFCCGCHVIFLSRVPTPQIITKAFQEVQPRLICLVPLIMEKIYKKRILPVLESRRVKLMLKIPLLEKKIYKKIRNSLTETFGGKFIEVIIGGAALSKEVEDFLLKIEFPFSVGYGMTECGPLISYSPNSKFRAHSCGKVVDRMQVRIKSDDPFNIVGEIQVKGSNVMKGYYKNSEATKEALDKDGWLGTGDLGIIDKDDNIYIKGRCKNMLLGPSGQNIYPEEIEACLNNMPFIQESIVTDDKDHKLIALIYPDYEACDAEGLNKDEIEEALNKDKQILNKSFPAYMKISRVIVFPEEFKKTPKRNIKRYLYTSLYHE